MANPQPFIKGLGQQGVDTILSLPCSAFASLLAAVDADPNLDHIRVTSEAEAVGIAAGVWMAGRSPAVLIQNSGFCDAINPICSLLHTFRIPVPFFVSVRGGFGIRDEPQHDLIGTRFLQILGALGLSAAVLLADPDAMRRQVASIFAEAMANDDAVIVAVPVGTFTAGKDAAGGIHRMCGEQPFPTLPAVARTSAEGGDCGYRRDVLAVIRQSVPASSIFVCSTGFIGRDLFELGDAPSQLYVAGSMGCASAIGFGISRYSDRLVVVLDGDGAALMRLGNMATLGVGGAGRLIHVVLNNGVYESTGGQDNYARAVDFAAVARACGYAVGSTRITSAERLGALIAAGSRDVQRGSPILFDTLTATRSPKPSLRPNHSCAEQARRLRRLLAGDRCLGAADAAHSMF